MNDFAFDIWYFATLSGDIKTGQLIRIEIAGQPITLGRKRDGSVFALRDICPHRAAPLSAGQMKGDTVECPYHGWRFDADDGKCTEIPALCSDQDMDVERIGVRSYPAREQGHLVWVYIAADPKSTAPPAVQPPYFALAELKPVMRDGVLLNCHVDHAVIGLMDPAHGPYVHSQWWWRSEKSMHEKAKAFEPRELGFAMARHSPSSNSFAYKILGGKPETEITFRLPGIRTEHVRVGKKQLLSFTAVTPIDESHTQITQVFFTDIGLIKWLRPVVARFAAAFLRQDANMVDLQQMGLKHDPRLMLVDDADTQAKWYHAIKREWAKSREEGRDFVNPVKARVLRWRS
ncbi:aromatic ring-hydroxylating oxygenase subunit alpha [Robiginitomaculum antarcticum]|uniref:aromatic ring-hydroxylating oxygenase subunit alpha n=1 Tax=Robiginitomaculum antarcticum TaxID=437507 RepID=UPI00037C2DC4|nr:aromatic ring-hydroxylating dioxygenase subunit alpha [Robiginitomaculum antarcticum]